MKLRRRLDRYVDRRIALTLIRWREHGNLLNAEQKRKLEGHQERGQR